MKKILLVALLINIAITGFAQNTIKFLGIPIDGTKQEMITSLKAKGYVYNSYQDCLSGEFNGNSVNISILTVNNRVWRIAVIAAETRDEVNIKFHYTQLMQQFLANGKYIYVGGNTPKDSDNLSYEIRVNKKRYDAYFRLIDTTINGMVWYTIAEDGYGKYRMCIFYENHNNKANGDDL